MKCRKCEKFLLITNISLQKASIPRKSVKDVLSSSPSPIIPSSSLSVSKTLKFNNLSFKFSCLFKTDYFYLLLYIYIYILEFRVTAQLIELGLLYDKEIIGLVAKSPESPSSLFPVLPARSTHV